MAPMITAALMTSGEYVIVHHPDGQAAATSVASSAQGKLHFFYFKNSRLGITHIRKRNSYLHVISLYLTVYVITEKNKALNTKFLKCKMKTEIQANFKD